MQQHSKHCVCGRLTQVDTMKEWYYFWFIFTVRVDHDGLSVRLTFVVIAQLLQTQSLSIFVLANVH
jgi:hypothetical protein